MGDELSPIRRPFAPDDLRPELVQNNVDRTVLVQTVSSLDETREFLETASQTDFVAGVVGWVDLTDPSVAELIASLRSAKGGDRLVGIRHQVHDEPDASWLLRDDVQRGIAAVGVAGLVYDVLVRTRELPAALATVRAHQAPRRGGCLGHCVGDGAGTACGRAERQLQGFGTRHRGRLENMDAGAAAAVSGASARLVRSWALHVRLRLAGLPAGGRLR